MNPVISNKRTIIGVFGSGTHPDNNPQLKFPFEVGKWIAENNYHLLTGGGAGVMKAACAGFCSIKERSGLSIGVIPSGKDPAIYPNLWVELPIYTHLQGLEPGGSGSRNHINVLSSDIILVFTGGIGTKSELELAVKTYKKSKRIIICLEPGSFIYDLGMESLKEMGITHFASSTNEIEKLVHDLITELENS